jgi:hypothetical protein
VAAKSTATQRTYQSSWNHFSAWCEAGDIDPNTTSAATIVEYLQYNLDQGRSISTVKTRVSAINYFHPGGTFRGSLGSHELVHSFIAGARRMYPQVRDKVPSWELPWVLQGMMQEPFEPLVSLPIRELTLKTVFLVAVCSARRVGELQALDCRLPYCSIGLGGVVLRTHSGFLPKVPSLANIEKKIELAPYGIGDDGVELPEHALCVCRALKRYLQVTKSYRKSSQLFVTFGGKSRGKAASKATIAGWVKNAIAEGYKTIGEVPPQGIKAHSTRHASASWNDLRGTSVLDICQQMSWTTPHTFVKHYKLDARHAQAVLDVHSQ